MMHANVVKLGFESDMFVQTAFLEMYGKSGDFNAARRVFDEMPERDLVAYNTMLAEYVGCGDITEAQRLFDDMPERDLVSWNTMINGYATRGDLFAARQMFDRSNERDLISWSSIISAYAQCRKSSEALRLFHEMQMHDIVPDKVTMVSVLSSCGDIGALSMGKSIHRFIERTGIEVDIRLGTSLIDMYSKCGDIENSLRVFHSLPKRDALCWSAMIVGLANHGLSEDAFQNFYNMMKEDIQPNDVTFVGVLSACNHAGLLGEGRALFNSMRDVYGINPKLEHYGCMVDLLGRSGLIEEAWRLVKSMPFEPDAIIWRSLLGACHIHKNAYVAEEAVKNLFELEPQVDGHYVLLSNIYAQANQWDDVAKVRKWMRVGNIVRVPGSSSIELENVVYEFVTGERSHPKSSQMYKMLEDITDHLRNVGYRPMTGLVLQDVDDQ
ncbi:Pentatricopeptide repeat-containing protein [Apostasia shenzhenica]|uniref:Pentatricopeptide repeat-containing protein n=1 Tax=Apostasia shenzhenica TaxID=1088818 RepID=A0A2I0AGU3_9ASPA|nr:Pentatricopeptide repeat-containing protein [Apostasia shenzhenica]